METEKPSLYGPGKLPTVMEMHRLPLWARLAFAARCARLTAPYFLKAYPDAPPEYMECMEKCIRTGEEIGHQDFTGLKKENGELFSTLNKFRPHDWRTAEITQHSMHAARMVVYVAHDIYSGHFQYTCDDAVSCGRAVAFVDEGLVPDVRRVFDYLVEKSYEFEWGDVSVEPVYFENPHREQEKPALNKVEKDNFFYFVKECRQFLDVSNIPYKPHTAFQIRSDIHQHNLHRYQDTLFEFQKGGHIYCEEYCILLFNLGNTCFHLDEALAARQYLIDAYQISRRLPDADPKIFQGIVLGLILWERDYGYLPDEAGYIRQWLEFYADDCDELEEDDFITYVRMLDRLLHLHIELGSYKDGVGILEAYATEKCKTYGAFDDYRSKIASLKLALTEYQLLYQYWRLYVYDKDIENGQTVSQAVSDKLHTEKEILNDIYFGNQSRLNGLMMALGMYQSEIRNYLDIALYVNFVELLAEMVDLFSSFRQTPPLFAALDDLQNTAESFTFVFEEYFKMPPQGMLFKLNKATTPYNQEDRLEAFEKIYDTCEHFADFARHRNQKRLKERAYPNYYFSFLMEYGIALLENYFWGATYGHITDFSENPGALHTRLNEEQKKAVNDAYPIFSKAVGFLDFDLKHNFLLLSEDAKLAYIQKLKGPAEYLMYYFSILRPDAQMLFEISQMYKGILLQTNRKINELIGQYANADLKTAHQHLRNVRANFTTIAETSGWENAGAEYQKAESALIRKLRYLLSPVSFEPKNDPHQNRIWGVRDRLKKGEYLIEILRFRQPFMHFTSEGFAWAKPLYTGIVVSREEAPDKVVYFPATWEEDELLSNYHRYLNGDQSVSDWLTNAIWQPIAGSLAEHYSLYFSPDGVFAKLNLEVLPIGKGRYVLDAYDVYLLRSGNELAHFANKTAQDGPPSSMLIGGVEYGSGSFEYLPYSMEEAKDIHKMLEKAGRQAELLSGAGASKGKLMAARPDLLHIATHGFVSEARAYPLLQVGLAISGDDRTKEGSDSGAGALFTMMDILNMDLPPQSAVVLSACRTAIGVYIFGQGVYSLPYAFGIAGAEAVIASISDVNDRYTQQLMVSFYENWLSGEYPTMKSALKSAQLTIREKRPEPMYWGSFIYFGKNHSG